MLTRECPVCAKHCTHDECYAVRGYSIIRCRECGLGATVVPPGFDTSTIYDVGFFEGGSPDGYKGYAASEEVLRSEFAAAIRYLCHFAPPGGKLLEIGCAYGYFLLEAQAQYQCVGIEISPSAADAARARGLQVATGEVTPAVLAAHAPFDVVVLLDVIEHLPDPAGTITLVIEHLAPRGVVMLTTGDWASLLARLTGRWWRLMIPPQHLFFFSLSNLTMLLQRFGLHIIDVQRPFKRVPLPLPLYQAARIAGPLAPLLRRVADGLPNVGVPINLGDAVRVVARLSARSDRDSSTLSP